MSDLFTSFAPPSTMLSMPPKLMSPTPSTFGANEVALWSAKLVAGAGRWCSGGSKSGQFRLTIKFVFLTCSFCREESPRQKFTFQAIRTKEMPRCSPRTALLLSQIGSPPRLVMLDPPPRRNRRRARPRSWSAGPHDGTLGPTKGRQMDRRRGSSAEQGGTSKLL